MNTRTPLSPARRALTGGLAVTAAGIAMLAAAGVDMPVVPPALVLLVAGAVLVATVRRRWAVVIGLVVALSEVAGFVVSGSVTSLLDASQVGVLAGNWVRLIGLVIALVAAVPALREPVSPRVADDTRA